PRMERRTFLLGLVGGLAVAAGLAATGSTPAEALPLKAPPAPVPGGADEAADIKPEDLDGVRTEDAQYYYYRRRRWRPRYRYYYRPRRRYWRRRYWRRRYW
ncbi:MAG TPA: hypothetical protein VE686_02830, partial [Beijerinckiaceae bacterium]|nr:hypothetical protein [Beijerinckiaceae bacterium]